MPATRHDCDFLIVGAGIAGASIGHFLAPHGHTVVLERESQPGYHSTGRSAALFMESYGTPQVRALTLASRAFLAAPPAGFADGPILSPRGALLVAAPGQDAALAALWQVMRSISPRGRLLDADGAREIVPALRRRQVLGAVFEPDAADIDVHRLHHGFLRSIRVLCRTGVTQCQIGIWRPNHPQFFLSKAKTQIHVVKMVRKIFCIETAGLCKD